MKVFVCIAIVIVLLAILIEVLRVAFLGSATAHIAHPSPNFRNLGTEVRPYSTLGPTAGRGLFALRDFAKGEVIERAPLLLFQDSEERPRSTLDEHLIGFDEDPNASAIGLGYFTMANHSDNLYNAELVSKYAKREVLLIATRNVRAGDEILTHYGDNYWGDNADRIDLV